MRAWVPGPWSGPRTRTAPARGSRATRRGGQQQNVPAPGDDVTLEVTLIYPLIVPLVNRVVFGIFVNFTATAQDRLNLAQISGPEEGPEDVMVYPTRALAGMDRTTLFNFGPAQDLPGVRVLAAAQSRLRLDRIRSRGKGMVSRAGPGALHPDDRGSDVPDDRSSHEPGVVASEGTDVKREGHDPHLHPPDRKARAQRTARQWSSWP